MASVPGRVTLPLLILMLVLVPMLVMVIAMVVVMVLLHLVATIWIAQLQWRVVVPLAQPRRLA